MRRYVLMIILCMLAVEAAAAPKQHVLTWGKWLPVKLFIGPDETESIDIKIRSLFVDGRLKEFTTGEPHDITERMFVVRRAFRVNDWLPSDSGTPHRWKWQRGGWLLIDRETGRVSHFSLPNFDPFYSSASWYRDYAAYCGLSDDGTRLYAMVVQWGRKKPLLKRELGAAKDSDSPDAQCAIPEWQRQPARVTFVPAGSQKLTFAVRGHAVDAFTEPAAVGGDEEH
jgi:hypothetical protein